MPRLPLNRSAADGQDTYRSSYAGSERTSIAGSVWDYGIGAPSVRHHANVPHGVPPLDLPSPRSDWTESVLASASASSRPGHSGGLNLGMFHISSPKEYGISESEMSGQRSPYPDLQEAVARFWRPDRHPDEQYGGSLSSRSGRSIPAARNLHSASGSTLHSARGQNLHTVSGQNLHSARGGHFDSREGSVAGSDTASWWSSIMPGTSCQSTVASPKKLAKSSSNMASPHEANPGVPSLNCTLARQSPKERLCDAQMKERARHCSAKMAERQCRFAQDCEDNINEVLFRDSQEEVEERPLRPPTDHWDDELQKKPDKLGTLKTWSPQG